MELQLGHIVERGEGFIKQQDFGRVGENRRHCDTLEHAPGELARPCSLDMT